MHIRRRLLQLTLLAATGWIAIQSAPAQTSPRPTAPAPATRPGIAPRPALLTTRPATRPATPTTRTVAPAVAAPIDPATLPPVPQRAPLATRPALPTSAPWYLATRLRLSAMKTAAPEMNLPPATTDALLQRISKASWDVDSASAVGADTGLAAQEVERAVEQLTQDLTALLKDQAPAFQARVTRISSDVRDLGRLDTSAFDTMVDLLLQPNPQQRRKIQEIMAEQRRQVEQIGLAPLEGAAIRRQDVGFAIRKALRDVFTPAQLTEWDTTGGPKNAGANAGAGPATRPAGISDAEAGYVTRLEVMKLAADELTVSRDRGISAAQQQQVKDRVTRMRADIVRVAAEPVTAKSKPTAERVDALRKDFLTDTTTILGARVGAFDDRVDRILANIYTLRSTSLKLDHDWVSSPSNDLGLTPDQVKKIDAILEARVGKLKEVDDKSSGESSAITRMKKDQVALTVRAEIRALLTPEQLQRWDSPAFLGR